MCLSPNGSSSVAVSIYRKRTRNLGKGGKNAQMKPVKELSTRRTFLILVLKPDQKFFVKHSILKNNNNNNPVFCIVQEVKINYYSGSLSLESAILKNVLKILKSK